MKLRILMLVAGLCLGLAACSGNDVSENPQLVLYNQESGELLTLGMSPEEVEAIVGPYGEPVEDKGNSLLGYGTSPAERLGIFYQDGALVEMSVGDTLDPTEESVWSLMGGITTGSTAEEVIKAYGETEFVENEATEGPETQLTTYYYNKNGERVENNIENDLAYMVFFSIGDNGVENFGVSTVRVEMVVHDSNAYDPA